MSRRASPPAAATVQTSPPDTNAISRRSGEMAGSDNDAFAGTGALTGVRVAAGVNATTAAAANDFARNENRTIGESPLETVRVIVAKIARGDASRRLA